MDLICDRECYADILEAAKASGSSFVTGYVRLLIDTINLKTFVRAEKDGAALELLRKRVYFGRNNFGKGVRCRL